MPEKDSRWLKWRRKINLENTNYVQLYEMVRKFGRFQLDNNGNVMEKDGIPILLNYNGPNLPPDSQAPNKSTGPYQSRNNAGISGRPSTCTGWNRAFVDGDNLPTGFRSKQQQLGELQKPSCQKSKDLQRQNKGPRNALETKNKKQLEMVEELRHVINKLNQQEMKSEGIRKNVYKQSNCSTETKVGLEK